MFVKNLDYDGTIYYVVNSFKHEHYLNCIKCRKKEKIDFCPVKEIEQTIVLVYGFNIIKHGLTQIFSLLSFLFRVGAPRVTVRQHQRLATVTI